MYSYVFFSFCPIQEGPAEILKKIQHAATLSLDPHVSLPVPQSGSDLVRAVEEVLRKETAPIVTLEALKTALEQKGQECRIGQVQAVLDQLAAAVNIYEYDKAGLLANDYFNSRICPERLPHWP